MEPQNSDWHLDKRVPIALIATLVAQSMGAIWWASSMQSRLQSVESIIAAQSANEGRLARLEQSSMMQSRALDRIEDKIDRINERARP